MSVLPHARASMAEGAQPIVYRAPYMGTPSNDLRRADTTRRNSITTASLDSRAIESLPLERDEPLPSDLSRPSYAGQAQDPGKRSFGAIERRAIRSSFRHPRSSVIQSSLSDLLLVEWYDVVPRI